METGNVYYSLCSGYNFYVLASRQKYKIFGKEKNVIQHIKTGEYFYVSEFPEDLNRTFDLNYWVKLIRNPVDLKHFIWPVDVIEWDATDKNNVKYALVFPNRALPVYDDFANTLKNGMDVNFDVPWVRKIIKDFLDAWCNFHSKGYAYHAFSKGNMFYNRDKMEVMFDFSFLTQRTDTLYEKKFINPEYITPDYADPYYYYKHNANQMDLASDYYTVAVFLFKLLIGRLPYEGKVFDNVANTTETEHNTWIKRYHKNSYFIFDTKDDTNRIGGEFGFADELVYENRWLGLSENVRNMFHNVFQTANALRTTEELYYYTPKQWLDALFGETDDVPLHYREAQLEEVTKISVPLKTSVPSKVSVPKKPEILKKVAPVSPAKKTSAEPEVKVTASPVAPKPQPKAQPASTSNESEPKQTEVKFTPVFPKSDTSSEVDARRKLIFDLKSKLDAVKTPAPMTEEGKALLTKMVTILNTAIKSGKIANK